jgi:hypothetical protein
MGKKTVSQAKNDVRSCLNQILDPAPSDRQKDVLWVYFDSKCGYCGVKLNRYKRQGQMDHLVSNDIGRFNHISNRVLSCGSCIGDEKRESDWDTFLKEKSNDDKEYGKKKKKLKGG